MSAQNDAPLQRVKAFFEEFPFLKSLVPDPRIVSKITVERADEALLTVRIVRRHTQIILVDMRGYVRAYVGYRCWKLGPRPRWWPFRKWVLLPGGSSNPRSVVSWRPLAHSYPGGHPREETLSETLESLGDAVYCIGWVVRIDFLDNHSRKLTIFKPPKSVENFGSWVKHIEEFSLKNIREV